MGEIEDFIRDALETEEHQVDAAQAKLSADLELAHQRIDELIDSLGNIGVAAEEIYTATLRNRPKRNQALHEFQPFTQGWLIARPSIYRERSGSSPSGKPGLIITAGGLALSLHENLYYEYPRSAWHPEHYTFPREAVVITNKARSIRRGDEAIKDHLELLAAPDNMPLKLFALNAVRNSRLKQ